MMTLSRCGVLFLFFVCIGIAQAEEFTATLVKVEDGKVTYTRGAGKKKSERTLPADEKCRVYVAKYDKMAKKIEAGDEVADGLKNPLFEKIEPQTMEAWIRTNPEDNKILELRIFQSSIVKKKKK